MSLTIRQLLITSAVSLWVLFVTSVNLFLTWYDLSWSDLSITKPNYNLVKLEDLELLGWVQFGKLPFYSDKWQHMLPLFPLARHHVFQQRYYRTIWLSYRNTLNVSLGTLWIGLMPWLSVITGKDICIVGEHQPYLKWRDIQVHSFRWWEFWIVWCWSH